MRTNQVNKYCSRACYFAVLNARSATRVAMRQAHREARCAERAIARAHRQQTALARREARRQCPCGAVKPPEGKWCQACYAKRIGDGIRAGREWARVIGSDHLCPNCGKWFKGHPADVFCSLPCARVMGKAQARGRYPSLRALPLDARNDLADLVALTREANRRLHKHD